MFTRTILRNLIFLPLLFGLLTCLNGCVRYDVGINFNHQHNGAIVQHIQLGEVLNNFNQSEAKQWLNSIETRAKQLAGKVKKVSSQEVMVTIPFGNGQELVEKFNQFFQTNSSEKSENLDLLKLASNLSLKQNNFLLVERNHLNLQVDLRGLGVLSEGGKIIVSPGSLIDLTFNLNSPWSSHVVDRNLALTEITKQGKQIIWQLKPGEINHLEAVFWLPSPLGIGTGIIFFLIIFGFYVKYQRFPLVS